MNQKLSSNLFSEEPSFRSTPTPSFDIANTEKNKLSRSTPITSISIKITNKIMYNLQFFLKYLGDGEDSYPKRRSKISIQLDDLKNEMNDEKTDIKDYDEFIKEEIIEDNNNYNELNNSGYISEKLHYSSNIIENNFNCLNKFVIYFYFKIANNEFVYPIETDFLNINKHNGYDMIKNIIKNINKKQITISLNNINYILSLKDSGEENNKYFYEKNYQIKPCHKKTLKPKNDSPNYCINSSPKEFINEKISFICNNEINIMLMEKFDNCGENKSIKINEKKSSKKNKIINIINEKKCNNYCLLF